MAGKKGMDRRTKAEIEAVREAAREEVKASEFPMSLRGVFYKLVSREDVKMKNTESNYKTLSVWLRDDRLLGDVRWEEMADDTREAKIPLGWSDPAEFVSDFRDVYRRDIWTDQKRLVEVWCEKAALAPTFSGVLAPYRVTLNIGKGYDGWTSIWKASERYKAAYAAGKETTVLYYGDFDPSGEDMYRSLKARFRDLFSFPEMPKVALTPEMAAGLPGDVTKADDTRAAAFIRKYGDKAVELDALSPERLRRSITTSVESYMDMEALEKSKSLEAEERKAIRESLDAL